MQAASSSVHLTGAAMRLSLRHNVGAPAEFKQRPTTAHRTGTRGMEVRAIRIQSWDWLTPEPLLALPHLSS